MIDLIHINKYYKNDEESLHVLKDVNLHIEQGEMVAVMGPSGSGKSTLINLLGFIDRKFEGTYLFEGESLVGTNDDRLSKVRNQTVGFVFQNFSLIENNTVYENVELPLLYGGYNFSQTKEKVLAALKRVGSSAIINFGLLMMDLAMATLCCCPPDNCFGYLSSLPSKPTRFKAASTFSLVCEKL